VTKKNEVLVFEEKKVYWTTSLDIADKFNKDHKNVLQAIRELEGIEEFSLHFNLSEYTKRCIKDIRNVMREVTSQYANKGMKLILIESMLSNILSHEYELEGVDTDKPNYGMFE